MLRTLPKTDDVLAHPALAETLADLPRALVVDAVRGSIEDARGRLLAGETFEPSAEAVARDAIARATLAARPSLRRVINATGIIVHTNLGRSVLSRGGGRSGCRGRKRLLHARVRRREWGARQPPRSHRVAAVSPDRR